MTTTVYTTAERFKELGLRPPDNSLFERPVKPAEALGREPIYNTRVLVDNWYEDRRQYKTLCPRCTGPTIYKSDYQPNCPQKGSQFPPVVQQRRLEADGEGFNLLRNTEDYCQYLQNYTTTSDLVHNWEVRRAGMKPKPRRRWRMIQGSIWTPQNDNTVSFGNLTQLGYRKAPQVPLLPNDWDLYANTGYITEYKESFPKRNYPEDYATCRRAPDKEMVQVIRDMTLIKKPCDPRDCCGDASLYHSERRPNPECCPCRNPRNVPRFGNLQTTNIVIPKPAKQTLYLPRQSYPYKAIKHPQHLPASRTEPCTITKARFLGGFEPSDHCRDYGGDTRFDYKGVLRKGTTL